MGLSYNDINTLFSDPTIEYSGGTRIVWSANQVYYDEAIVGISPGVQYDTIVVGKEAISGNSGTLAKHPIVPGSVILSNGYSTFIDNGLGVLYASLSPHTGTINYTNGNWSVTGWVGITAATAMYMAVTSPAFVSIDWDGVMFPTIKGLTHIKPVGTGEHSIAHEKGTLHDVSIWTGVEEYSNYVDLMQLVPLKFRSSTALQQLLYVFGIQAGTWIGEINDLQTIQDKYRVGQEYIQYLADLVGYDIIITPTTTYDNMKEQLLNVIDWYKMKGTYQALKVIGYTLGYNLNIWDLYTQDYINFVQVPWYVGAVGTNPTGLSSSYYKSPHLGVEIVLNQILGTPPNYYLFAGASTYTNLITYIELVRPINVVPQYSIFLNPVTNRRGTVQGDQYTTTSTTSLTMPTPTTVPAIVTLTAGTGVVLTPGQNISVVYNTANQMQGKVVTYNATTGQLVVNVSYVAGSGTYSSWNIMGNITSITLGSWITSQVYYDSSYSTGTVSIVNGGTALTGLGTLWTQSLTAGDQIGFGSTDPSAITMWYDVGTVGSNTSITIASGNVTNEAISGNSGTLANHPVVAGSVLLTDGWDTYVDNGAGSLVGSLSSSVTGSITYSTGAWSVPHWIGTGSRKASYQVPTYIGTTLSGSAYVSVPHYDAAPILTHDLTYDSAQSTFYNGITIWRLGTGNVGVIPNSGMTSLQTPVLTNYGGSVSAPLTVDIQNTYVEYSFLLPNTITQNGVTELGLFLADGTTMELISTFPAINLVAGEALRVIVHVNY